MDKFRNYTQKSFQKSMSTIITGAGLILFGVIMLLFGSTFTSLTLILLGLYILLQISFQMAKAHKNIKKWTSNKELDLIITDFQKAAPIADDSARLGSVYIYRRDQCEVIPYSSILQGEFVDKKANLPAGASGGILLKLKGNKKCLMCAFYGRTNKEHANAILQQLHHKNPQIQISSN